MQYKTSPHLLNLGQRGKRLARIISWSVIIILLIVFFFQARYLVREVKNASHSISDTSGQALWHIESALDSLGRLSFDQAKEELSQANLEFAGLEEELERSALYQVARLFPYGRDAFRLLGGARLALAAGQDLTEVVKILASPVEFGYLPSGLFPPSTATDSLVMPEEIGRINFLVTISRLANNMKGASLKLSRANQELARVNGKVVPTNFRENFGKVKSTLKDLEGSLTNLSYFTERLDRVFGADGLRRYLVLFQNNNEIRATGGFIGSFALVDIDHGRIKRIEMPGTGSYALQKYLRVSVASPRPLWPLKPQWQFHDANWFADWPASAEKLAWFYENSGGVTVDGVVAITADLVAELLDFLGPIELARYGKTIDGASFIEEIQKHVEVESRMKKEEPKQILVDLAPKILEKILTFQEEKNSQNLIAFLQFLNKSLLEKKVLVWLKDEELEEWLEKENWAGQIRENSKDFLYLVVSNSNGAKTEGVIDQALSHQITVDPQGNFLAEVTVERSHLGKPGELFTGKESIDWLRFYLPEGSVLLEAEGFEKILARAFMQAPIGSLSQDEDLMRIEKEEKFNFDLGIRETKEFGKTCFGGFLRVKPGEISRARIKYRLPISAKNKGIFSYSLLVQKQPGMKPGKFESRFVFEDGLPEVRWQYPEDESLKVNENSIEFRTKLDQDKYWAVVLD